MSCDEFKQLLDAYIDGELSGAEMQALEEHAKACEACREELAAARLLKDTLAHMDDDIAVPLQAQAAWRSAVRTEAGRQKRKKWMRYAYAAAAVLVLVFGVNVAMDRQPVPQPEMMVRGVSADQANSALVASDSLQKTVNLTVEAQEYTVRRKITVESARDALDKLSQLAAEYSGSFAAEGDLACRIEISGEYLEDFTKAASRIGSEVYSEIAGQNNGTAVILIQIAEE